ncbi:MAG TPA: DEAD/DEAH box helicase [Chitinispirillaceae bacterium]|jgi:superfamily II DNA or RNA helicase|nr:DEAD/DEAH box helicase [Chitinispirillaceae bacterium]
MSTQTVFNPGSLVYARGREWVVLPQSDKDTLYLRTLSGTDSDITRIYCPLEREPVKPASFLPPDPNRPGTSTAVRLLQNALMLKLRAGAGPFRSFGNIAIEPRAYQLVPLLMALKHATVRLLIADDVGIGKTIEAGLILRELFDRGEIRSASVLCPPHLCDQWRDELSAKFNIEAVIVRPGTVGSLERGLPHGQTIFREYPFTIISLDYIKSDKRRDEFLHACPEFVIVDEAHSCSRSGSIRHQRFTLLRDLSLDPDRHMIFLTATPHSGDENSFTNLLSLINPEFAELRTDSEISISRREELRIKLGNHFVQRRRADIEEWQDTTLFPDRQRKSPDPTYKLTSQWKQFFTNIKRYARSIINDSINGTVFQQRLSWWAALALLRCVSSSPAAAVRALQTRLDSLLQKNDNSATTEDIQIDSILDGTSDDDLVISDVEPGAAQNEYLDQIRSLIETAESLCGIKKDPKLARLAAEVTELVNDGFAPVIFCRYIATANYLKNELSTIFKNKTVDVVTGELAPVEREEKIMSLRGTRPIMIATDCLSEGINLQDVFDAVIHYDLSWNPTRHDQREGRVDRFGQKAKIVKTVMIYGEDNPVDGIVLENILRKVKLIEKELGVPVSMPDDSEKLSQAIVSSVLLKGEPDAEAISLFGPEFFEKPSTYLDSHWESLRKTAKRNVTRFAQRALKPDDVMPEWNKAMKALGTEDDVENFVCAASRALSTPVEKTAKGLRLPVEHLPAALRERVENGGLPDYFDLHYPPQSGAIFVHRTHPAITAIADYLAEVALSQSDTSLIARCGAIFTNAVEMRTAIYLLRLRSQLALRKERSAEEKLMLAEEAVIIAISGGKILTDDALKPLLEAQPVRDMVDSLKARQIKWALDQIQEMNSSIEALAKARAEELLKDHRRVREAANARGSYGVKPVLPADIIGAFVLVPARMVGGGVN